MHKEIHNFFAFCFWQGGWNRNIQTGSVGAETMADAGRHRQPRLSQDNATQRIVIRHGKPGHHTCNPDRKICSRTAASATV